MSFLFRAALVIGVLSYFAMQRPSAVPNPNLLVVGRPDRADATLPPAWNALPADARQHVTASAASEMARIFAETPRSEDTLGEMDRWPEWRGVKSR